jgi:hypothetical protein
LQVFEAGPQPDWQIAEKILRVPSFAHQPDRIVMSTSEFLPACRPAIRAWSARKNGWCSRRPNGQQIPASWVWRKLSGKDFTQASV